MIEKTEKMNLLLDCYGNLLTTKQKDIMELYYQEDLSLQEIAQELNISRSAVFDLVKRSAMHLEKQEEMLGLLEKQKQRNELYKELKDLHLEKVDEIVTKLEKI